jgi:hypothetical protein
MAGTTMRLPIPKDKAIKIIQDRISELGNNNLNIEAWSSDYLCRTDAIT